MEFGRYLNNYVKLIIMFENSDNQKYMILSFYKAIQRNLESYGNCLKTVRKFRLFMLDRLKFDETEAELPGTRAVVKEILDFTYNVLDKDQN